MARVRDIQEKAYWDELERKLQEHYSKPGAIDKFLREMNEILGHKEKSTKKEKSV